MQSTTAAPNRIVGLPTEPLIVFSAAHNWRSAPALAAQRVESIMCSFEYVRNSTLETFTVQYLNIWDTWPVRRFLDSGIFTLMSESGVTRITTKAKGRHMELSRRERLKILAKQYTTYLISNQQHWDHVAELDCDEVPDLGPELAHKLRAVLTEIVGEKLLPVWHPQAGVEGLEGWDSIITRYPYVAIGSDTDMNGNYQFVRDLVRRAHAGGVRVHLMGTASEEIMVRTEADSGDTSAWTAGLRNGSYDGISFSHVGTKKGQRMSSKHAAFATAMEAQGINIANLLIPGKNQDKMRAGIFGLQQREQRVRASYRARHEAGVQ